MINSYISCTKCVWLIFKDISTYPTQKNKSTHDDYDHLAYAWNNCNNNTQEKSKISKTALETKTGEAEMSNKNMEAGFYNTLNLRVFDNEEHRPLKRSRSESSSLYVKSSIPLEPSAFCTKRVLNCNRTSSLRLTKSTDRNGKAEKGITKTNKNDEPSLNFYVYDLATFQDKSSVSQRQLFLEELSSHNLYLKKY